MKDFFNGSDDTAVDNICWTWSVMQNSYFDGLEKEHILYFCFEHLPTKKISKKSKCEKIK